MLQRTIQEMRSWLQFSNREDKDYLRAIEQLKDEEVEYFYNTLMVFSQQANKKFAEFVKNYKEIY